MKNAIKLGFGTRLRIERERLGFSQLDFAEHAGIKRVSQYLYERESNSPNVRYLNAISELGVDLSYLFFDTKYNAANIDHHPDLLSNIFIVVDQFARDEKGRPLALEDRLSLFNKLSATYAGTNDSNIDVSAVVTMLKK